MKWVTNMGMDEWMKMDIGYRLRHVMGKPKATESMTAKDLERMGLVGIYEE